MSTSQFQIGQVAVMVSALAHTMQAIGPISHVPEELVAWWRGNLTSMIFIVKVTITFA